MYCGVCHTDVHYARNDWGVTMYPVVPGHEITGIITKVGSDVKEFEENYCDELHATYNGVFWDGTITYDG
ncbi:hypothetical protein Sjap_009897 [Stephania japonica]|uniref:Alcohol dehydrogenase-like N-terminal domain-containing protein n=1 Tax=Stephania japonica TaxID=461633 RepID=A0AAP0J9E3_9MAGN